MKTAEASIFIIEDDNLFRETFIDVMALRGLEVQGAATGFEGLRRLQGCAPSVIVLDVQLPDVHGFDLCRRIKRMDAFRDTPVLFLSATAQQTEMAEMLAAGASAFLPKPVGMDELWAEIERLLPRDSH